MKIPDKIVSISALHRFFKLKKPLHPLISVFDLADTSVDAETILNAVSTDFYVIALKKECSGSCKYGQQYYDFEEGIMYFMAPHQVLQFEEKTLLGVQGVVLVVHPDFFHGYSVAGKVKEYGYFSYSSHEALHVSEREEKLVIDLIQNIGQEIEANLDSFTQDLLIANIELLLTYCDRFYTRQFLTRKKVNSDLLSKLENVLDAYFKADNLSLTGIPTVQFVAHELNVSPNYLSDLLRVHTGLTTQQHIQNRLIEKAKELLSTTGLSISEIAYQLGFDHPQSFHRLFKNKTSTSPLEFRQSFN